MGKGQGGEGGKVVEQMGLTSTWGSGGKFNYLGVLDLVVGMGRPDRPGGKERIERGTVKDGGIGGVKLVADGLENLEE